MTLGLGQWLRLLGFFGRTSPLRHSVPPLDLKRLGARDIADLNLPQDVVTKLEAWHADEKRLRSFR
mgnify:CR=1 FL=1